MSMWIGQRMAEERGRDLAAMAVRARPVSDHEIVGDLSRPLAAVPARPVERERSVSHRQVGHLVGHWLIRAGTRLGGASMRTS
jgi:hypothetical protein